MLTDKTGKGKTKMLRGLKREGIPLANSEQRTMFLKRCLIHCSMKADAFWKRKEEGIFIENLQQIYTQG
ncbi:hypothetical protein [Thermocrinis minervae]|uniref:hypothetical protein n=1 Tax=Thermocrinis minervae TaxID=381751 RepID=UPI001E626A86|nr:hypothetical protein [Thermocrinis minervae]